MLGHSSFIGSDSDGMSGDSMEQRDYWAACAHLLEEMSECFDWFSWYGHLSENSTEECRERLKKLFESFGEALTQSQMLEVVFGVDDRVTPEKILRVLGGMDMWSASGINDGVERAAWEKRNFSPQEAMVWRAKKFSPYQAYRWSRESASYTKRYTVEQAAKWRSEGFDVGDAWPSSWEPEVAVRCIREGISARSIEDWRYDSKVLLTKNFHVDDFFVRNLIQTDFKPEHYSDPCWMNLTPEQIWSFWSVGIKNPKLLEEENNSCFLSGSLVPGDQWLSLEEVFRQQPEWNVGLISASRPEDRQAKRKIVKADHPSGPSVKIVFSVVGDLIRAVSNVEDEIYWYYSIPEILVFLETLKNPSG